jgi:glycosyltransferase involved in cell wall biosynthesis
MDNNGLRILVLEPYYGGSHKTFLDGLRRRLPFDFTFMTFPARKWKWRMRLAAPFYARKLHETGQRLDRILCSSFVDVATFRGLAPAWTGQVPLLTYFHENQFVYPVQAEDERDLHFFLTNVTTTFASDRIAFNSSYNMRSFVEGAKKLLRSSHDMRLDDPSEVLEAKSRVLPPGIDFAGIDATQENNRDQIPVVLWNHRWEHDKNPELFFSTLFKLDKEGLDFRLVVLGQSYRESPRIFEEARKRLGQRLLHFGYAHSQEEYARWLKCCDIVVSTAVHEFFGIAVVEAVRAGCRPLLPRRLSYPELFPDDFLYGEGELLRRLRQEISKKERLPRDRALELTERFSWDTVAPEFRAWLEA